MKQNSTLFLAAAVGMAVAGPMDARGGEIQELKTFYFGNSFLENSMVGLHGRLGESAGKKWDLLGALIHPGVPIWVHALRQDEPESVNHKKFYENGAKTGAIVMLLFGGSGLSFTTHEMWGKEKFDPPRDVGDVASCAGIIGHYLKMNPKGKAYVYSPWPYNPAVRELRDRIKKESQEALKAAGEDRGETMKKVKERKPTDEEMDPIRKSLDYASVWLTTNYLAEGPGPEVKERLGKYAGAIGRALGKSPKIPVTLEMLGQEAGVDAARVKADLASVRVSEGELNTEGANERVGAFVHGWPNTHSRAHAWAVMEGLKKRYPAMWDEGRLGMIPVGDVFLAVDAEIKAGRVLGLVNVGEFSADGGHIRSGLPRYTVAATFYAVLFQEHPGKLDWRIYGDRSNYENKENLAQGKLNIIGGHYVHVPDLGTHLEITEERAKAVNDAIWEVVSKHPYTQVK